MRLRRRKVNIVVSTDGPAATNGGPRSDAPTPSEVVPPAETPAGPPPATAAPATPPPAPPPAAPPPAVASPAEPTPVAPVAPSASAAPPPAPPVVAQSAPPPPPAAPPPAPAATERPNGGTHIEWAPRFDPLLPVDPSQIPATPPAPVASAPTPALVQTIAPPPAPVAVAEAMRPVASTPGDGQRPRLGELLVAEGVLTPQQLDHALVEQVDSGRQLGAQVVQMGYVSERALIEALAGQLQVPVADLRLTVPEPAAVSRLPEELARRYEVVPLRMISGALEIALATVLDDDLRMKLEAGAHCPVTAVLAPASEIRQAIERCYLVIGDVQEQVEVFEALASSRPKAVETTPLEVDDHAPVVQVVTLLLTQAVRDRASDIHIEPQGDRVRVRFRVDGVLREVTALPEAMAQALVSRIKVMSDMNIVERRRPQDGQFATVVDDRPLDVRVSTTTTVFGEKAVLRLLDKTRTLINVAELGMTPEVGAHMEQLVSAPFGMVVCAGPTGSGKTTTLYAALKAIDDPTRNITTIEDPVEYVVPSINQIQVNNQAGVTFADGLRSILRQDPDVILVGEVRDVETAGIAVQSALTGHLVLSSVHATDSATAIQRFRDMDIEAFLVTSAVLAVVAQRLVRRICPHCRTPYDATAAERAFFAHATGKEKDMFWRGAGCNLCAGTGYSHRTGVYELLRVTEPIKKLIMTDAGYEAIRAQAIAEGMKTLRDEVLRLVDEDVTTIAEAARSVFVH